MSETISMPKLGFDMREGVLTSWLKEIGDTVNKGDVVAEIESDKATLELEAQTSGTLLHLLHSPGDVVPVGANMAIVGKKGEDFSAMVGGNGAGNAEVVEAKVETAEKQAPEGQQPQATPEAAAQTESSEPDSSYPAGVKATPVARRIAEEKKVDLLRVQGTGPEGRITKADVEAFSGAPAPAAKAPTTASREMVTTQAGDEEVPLTRLRSAIGRRMVESKTTVPHFYVTTEIDMAAVMTLRKQINSELPEDRKVSVNDLIVKAAALALRDFPNLNTAFAGDKVVRHGRINVGSAVAIEGGLTTVVQKDTDTSTLSKVAADNRAMIARAREGKVRPDDVEGGTFTVSNLGLFDVDHFIAIINPPEAAILAVGSVREVPVVSDGQLAVGMRMKVTLSADHRVTDGAEVAKYLQTLKGLLEKPLRLLV